MNTTKIYEVVRYYHVCAEYLEREVIKEFTSEEDAIELCNSLNRFLSFNEYEVEKEV